MTRLTFSPLRPTLRLSLLYSLSLLTGCLGETSAPLPTGPLELNVLTGALFADVCGPLLERFNASSPLLQSGRRVVGRCELQPNDAITPLTTRLTEYHEQKLSYDSPLLPALALLDGDLAYTQLVARLAQLFPEKTHFVPPLAESLPVAFSPLVWMVPAELGPGMPSDLGVFTRLASSRVLSGLSPKLPSQPIRYAHAVPSRSSAGLQALALEFAACARKAPEQLTLEDVTACEPMVKQLEARAVRYGAHPSGLAQATVQFGPSYVNLALVPELSVIQANRSLPAEQTTGRFVAVYPEKTFSTPVRALIFGGAWVSPEEREAAKLLTSFLRGETVQRQLAEAGLRSILPALPLAEYFKPELGANPAIFPPPLLPPPPEVMDAMLESWSQRVKRPSRRVLVLDTSSSMEGPRLEALKAGVLQSRLEVGPLDTLGVLDFDSDVRDPVMLDPGAEAVQSVLKGLEPGGGSRLYDALLLAQSWVLERTELPPLPPPTVRSVAASTPSVSPGAAPGTTLAAPGTTLAAPGTTLAAPPPGTLPGAVAGTTPGAIPPPPTSASKPTLKAGPRVASPTFAMPVEGPTRMLVVVTDGDDAVSQKTLETLQDSLRRTGVGSSVWLPVYALGVGTSSRSSASLLEELAHETGGTYTAVEPGQLSTVLEQLASEF